MILDKAKMAHEWAMKHGKVDSIHNRKNTVELAWEYADLMQAQADERVVKLPDVFFDTKPNEDWYPEYEVGRIYSPDDYVMYKGEKTLAVSINEEWQPDWSQSPKWANVWAIDENNNAYWYCGKYDLVQERDCWMYNSHGVGDGRALTAPSFNYIGKWQDSLRKRPN